MTERNRLDELQVRLIERIDPVLKYLATPRAQKDIFSWKGCLVGLVVPYLIVSLLGVILAPVFAANEAFWITASVVAIIIVGNLAYRWRDLPRERAIAALAARLGLEFSAKDPHRLQGLPFELIRTGGPATYRNLIWGILGGMPLASFEYRRFERTKIGERYLPYHFSCAMTALPVDAPHLIVERLGPDTHQLPPAMGEAPIVRTESIEFDRAFRVRSDDRRFTLAVLDPSVMGWLIGTAGKWNVEILGDRLLCYSPVVPVERLEDLFAQLRGLRDRFTHVARDLAPRVDSAGGLLDVREGPLPRVRRPIQYQDLVGRPLAVLVIVGMLLYLLVLWGVIPVPRYCC